MAGHEIPEGFRQHPDVDVEPSSPPQQQSKPGSKANQIETTIQKITREDIQFGGP